MKAHTVVLPAANPGKRGRRDVDSISTARVIEAGGDCQAGKMLAMNIDIAENRMPVVSVGSVVCTDDAVELGAMLGEATMRSPRGFVVDLSSLESIDCTTMSIVLRAYRSVVGNGGRMVVVTGPSLAVRAMATMLMKGLPSLHMTQDMDGLPVAMPPHHHTVRRRSAGGRSVGRFAVAA